MKIVLPKEQHRLEEVTVGLGYLPMTHYVLRSLEMLCTFWGFLGAESSLGAWGTE